MKPVAVVTVEPDFWSRGHFYEGRKPYIDQDCVRDLPIGTKLYTHPPAAEVREVECAWIYDEDTDAWNGTCGAMWQFTAGDPDDNDMHYCPKCGKRAALSPPEVTGG